MTSMLALAMGQGAAPARGHARIALVTSYFDLSTANERLAELRPLLDGLRRDRDAVAEAQLRLAKLADGNGDQDGAIRRERQALVALVGRMEASVRQIDAWGITLREISSGLVDFPALANGRPIWLCWKLGEGNIGWWHELQAGVAGRRPLIELE
jgi:hypothetical protein